MVQNPDMIIASHFNPAARLAVIGKGDLYASLWLGPFKMIRSRVWLSFKHLNTVCASTDISFRSKVSPRTLKYSGLAPGADFTPDMLRKSAPREKDCSWCGTCAINVFYMTFAGSVGQTLSRELMTCIVESSSILRSPIMILNRLGRNAYWNPRTPVLVPYHEWE